MFVLYASHEGNAGEENNGYVVFKMKYPLKGGGVGGEWGGRRSSAHLSTRRLLDRYLCKDDVNVFPPRGSLLHGPSYPYDSLYPGAQLRLEKSIYFSQTF